MYHNTCSFFLLSVMMKFSNLMPTVFLSQLNINLFPAFYFNCNQYYVSSLPCVFIHIWQHILFAMSTISLNWLVHSLWKSSRNFSHHLLKMDKPGQTHTSEVKEKLPNFEPALSCLPHQNFYSASLLNHSATNASWPKWFQIVYLTVMWKLPRFDRHSAK